jgi:hypothetical protein
LRPRALVDQHLLDARRLFRSGTHRGEIVAENSRQPRANLLGAAGVAARLFLDDPLEGTGLPT